MALGLLAVRTDIHPPLASSSVVWGMVARCAGTWPLFFFFLRARLSTVAWFPPLSRRHPHGVSASAHSS